MTNYEEILPLPVAFLGGKLLGRGSGSVPGRLARSVRGREAGRALWVALPTKAAVAVVSF